MSAVSHFLAGIIQSSDGHTPSSARVIGVVLAIAFIVKMFVHPDVGVLTACGGFACVCLGLRDGGPLDSFLQAKVAIAASAPGATPAPPLPASAA